MRTAHLTTSDGHSVGADVAPPDPAAGAPIGAVAVCHPHPMYGGDRHNTVVSAVFAALPPAGFAAVRFDFRRDHGGGVAERLDLVAALDALAAEPGVAELPLAVVGYSFGAGVALATDDDRIRACVAIAPPLGMMPAPAPSRPTLVLTPRHDQFCDADAAATATAGWRDAELEIIESADHFLAGHTGAVAERAVAWLTDRLCPTGPARNG